MNSEKNSEKCAEGKTRTCKRTKLHDGFSDNLTPTKSIDLQKCKSVNDLVLAMRDTAFGGRQLGEAADVFEAMVREESCLKMLTLSGAMTVAKMGLVICDMIELGLVDIVISTGALMAHGFVEAAGMTHFKYDPSKMDDKELYYAGYDRVYDTLELEKNLDDTEVIVREVLEALNGDHDQISSYLINERLGEYLHKNVKGRGVLKSAFEKKVPVFIPAFTDSELGLDYGLYRRRLQLKGKKCVEYNPYLDLEKYTSMAFAADNLGIFTIGGGVPRNWAQQVGPYLDIIEKRGVPGGAFKRFKYGVRICPEPVHWGGLSGCTYSEGISWGKFIPKEEGGMFAEVMSDATIAWPFVVKAVMERLEKNPLKK
ncbi:putative deoxyhypusine synthase [Candidatus Gugararchaeum adminiculabundum]|nr:putative deoxyhypusine synthase [Candidatus Gugararchaeum adminiculabundum]